MLDNLRTDQTKHTALTLSLGILFVFASGTTLTSCVTVQNMARQQRAPCQKIDWFEIGRIDGVNGEPPSVFREHNDRCHAADSSQNHDVYMAGRDAGLVEFCTAQSGFEIGKTGRVYHNVCPPHLEAKFLPAFEVGNRIRVLEWESRDITSQIDDVFGKLSRLPQRDDELKARLDDLRGRRAKIENRISDIENNFFRTL